jgi:hypothetical protein
MDKNEFAIEEYKHLRIEISAKMGNQYKILSLGIGGITVIVGAIFQFKVYELFLVLPFLIFANAYLYKAETHAIINAGNYIKKIENCLYRNNSKLNKCDKDEIFGDMGWENHLKRKTYKHFEYIVDVIFGSLYLMSGICAWKYTWSLLQFQSIALCVATIAFIMIYVGIIGCWIYWIKNVNPINREDDEKYEKITRVKK